MINNKIPDAPKRPESAYFRFKRENFERIKAKYPGKSAAYLSKFVSEEFNKLTETEKKKLEPKPEAIAEWQKKKAEWDKTYGDAYKAARAIKDQKGSDSGRKASQSSARSRSESESKHNRREKSKPKGGKNEAPAQPVKNGQKDSKANGRPKSQSKDNRVENKKHDAKKDKKPESKGRAMAKKKKD
jgi:hypothetical protein